ncbi:glycosyl hydrolase family 65 protein [Shigella flexneri]
MWWGRFRVCRSECSPWELHLAPALPEHWQQLSFPLRWQGSICR